LKRTASKMTRCTSAKSISCKERTLATFGFAADLLSMGSKIRWVTGLLEGLGFRV
jgi:hypothetical protein